MLRSSTVSGVTTTSPFSFVVVDPGMVTGYTMTIKPSSAPLIPDTLNTREYKAIISQCKVFIGARTHSTIAAYSTCVPTFVFGYSIKSLGIAKDLFGDHKGLVAKVYDPSGFDDMMNDLKDFLSKTDDYKAVLEKKMPDYIRQAESSVYELSKI